MESYLDNPEMRSPAAWKGVGFALLPLTRIRFVRPHLWHPPTELSPLEKKVVSRILSAKLFIFLRDCRHELFDDEFQMEFASQFVGQQHGGMSSFSDTFSKKNYASPFEKNSTR